MERLAVRESINKSLYFGGLVATSLFLSNFAFTRKIRQQIYKRDRSCQEPPPHNGGLEAAHYDHDKSNPDYNSPSNGRLLCTEHHLEDHVQNAGLNGLPESQNNWAISMIKKRLNR